jgi:homoserine dehydrogenase
MAESGKQAVGVGLIGFGTIGRGVVVVLQRNARVIEQRLGFPLRLVRIADLDVETDRRVDLEGVRFDSDSEGLIADPEVDIVIELIGGYGIARKLTLAAIEAGKHVVSANKALLALHGAEIFAAADKQGVDVGFEAGVGGGIPILRSLREGLAANQIQSEDFEVVLKRAQELGYAEADPTFDVDGIDAAHKLALLTSMAFGAALTFEEIPTEGIGGLVPLDFEMAAELGYRIKLLGIAKSRPGADGDRIEARVHPTMVPTSSLLAQVDGAMNAVAVHGDAVGPTLYYGAGAGELPTASAVVADLMEIAREIRRGQAGRVAPLSYMPNELVPMPLVPLGELHARCYLRFTAVDRPGVLSRITGALGEKGIGIESVIQKGRGEPGESVPVIVLTHPVAESAVHEALQEIDRDPNVTAKTALVRIEEEL